MIIQNARYGDVCREAIAIFRRIQKVKLVSCDWLILIQFAIMIDGSIKRNLKVGH